MANFLDKPQATAVSTSVDGAMARTMNASRSSARASHPQQRQRQLNFSSTRTPYILSIFICLTLFAQFLLVYYHDEIVLQPNSIEGELLEDAPIVKPIAHDVRGAANEYTDGDIYQVSVKDGRNRDSSANGKTGTPTEHYSMDPLHILKRAGVDLSAGVVLSQTSREARLAKERNQPEQRQRAVLPSIEDIQQLYGNRSFIIGAERCEAYREKVTGEHRLMGPAGLFNTATNLLNKLLSLNCSNKQRQKKGYSASVSGMRLQAPWGKHNPVRWRGHHEAQVGGKGVTQTDFLPIVMIKDPISWMASMCRHPYSALWRHNPTHCPNLIPNKFDRGRKPGQGTMQVKVRFATQHIGKEPLPDKGNKTFVEYTTLLDVWNTWYGEWYDVKFPRLMVRFEDLMFHAEETVAQVCECGGGTMKPTFRYIEGSAKGTGGPHAGSAGFLASLVTYGNKTLRMGMLKGDDLEYAKQHVDRDLMQTFGYAPI